MQNARIYQIFYSEQTRASLDEGFIPLDNTNKRPDWYEYSAIRDFLHKNELNDDTFYGFLSPSFKAKTGLDATAVHAFVASVPPSTDVVSFSPFFDAGALFVNVFQQGAHEHPNAWPAFVESARLMAPGANLDKLVMDSTQSVFCNYFVAKPRFWRHWFDRAELIFQIAEQNASPLGQALNAGTQHRMNAYATKVFVMERLVALLLAIDPQWRVTPFNSMLLPLVYPNANRVAHELVMLDALKKAARATGLNQYMEVFASLRARVLTEMSTQR
ncbi:hypothetical protein SAMN05443245_0176 [Paraburkholderia fungorum]|uniref:Uncharacterized protein n=1 Tax=Paraburkholderia fungorum TaxID=134537 RepID=A0A1H0YMU8_9BURK|nr:hypothetical protein [Paraburkholderia fungorum]SDQ16494.1 hypothetical protein SAMN05443245_0176 [Paraburkholderia fungorum]